MAERILDEHKNQVAAFELEPSSGGVFELRVNGELVYSKKAQGRFPEEGEAETLVRQKISGNA